MAEIDVRAEIDEFRFADGEPGENNVCVYDGYLVINGDGRQEVEIHAEDIDNLIEALKRAKDAHPVSVTSKEEAKEYGRYSLGIDTIYFDNEIYPWTVEVTSGEFSDWIRHDGGECPVHSMDMVEISIRSSTDKDVASVYYWGQGSACSIDHYRIVRDEDGLPYVSNEDLEPWAEYVATDEDGEVGQFETKPERGRYLWSIQMNRRLDPAPDQYKNTSQHWAETLRRVWRK